MVIEIDALIRLGLLKLQVWCGTAVVRAFDGEKLL